MLPVVICSRNRENLLKAEEELKKIGSELHKVEVDLGKKEDIEKLKEIDHIGYEISFKDAWNKKYRTTGKLGLGEILQTWAKSHMMYDEEPLKKMEQHLKNIDNNIRNIGRIIEKFGLDEIIGYKIDEYILEKIKEKKKIL